MNVRKAGAVCRDRARKEAQSTQTFVRESTFLESFAPVRLTYSRALLHRALAMRPV